MILGRSRQTAEVLDASRAASFRRSVVALIGGRAPTPAAGLSPIWVGDTSHFAKDLMWIKMSARNREQGLHDFRTNLKWTIPPSFAIWLSGTALLPKLAGQKSAKA